MVPEVHKQPSVSPARTAARIENVLRDLRKGQEDVDLRRDVHLWRPDQQELRTRGGHEAAGHQAGKSTTMRMILGLDRPTSGSALVNGHPYDRSRRPLNEIGALLDAKNVHGGRTARAHLLALAQSNGIPRERVDAVLEMVGLTPVAKKRIGGFSFGMAQRLGLAATMLGDPQILMLDEPINGLDPKASSGSATA